MHGLPTDSISNAEAMEVYSPWFSTSYHLHLGHVGIDLLGKIWSNSTQALSLWSNVLQRNPDVVLEYLGFYSDFGWKTTFH